MPHAFRAKMMRSLRALKVAFQRFMQIDGSQRGAAFAYYAFFSLFPLAVLFVAAGSLFVEREVAIEEIIRYAEKFVPLAPEMEQRVLDTISGVAAERGKVGLFASLVLLWGSTRFFKALLRATNRAWGGDLYTWWQTPLKSIALLGVLASAVVLGIAVPIVANLAERWLPAMHGLVPWLGRVAIRAAPTLVLFYGLALFYRLAPSRDTSFAEVWPAAVFATLSLQVVGGLFVLYVKSFGDFNVVYGTFGGIMALLMWIYLSGCIIIFGACLTAGQLEVASGRREEEG